MEIRLLHLGVGLSGAATLVAAIVTGCSGDNTAGGGPDAGNDATTDVSQSDAPHQPDVPGMDSPQGDDSGDAGADVVLPGEAGADGPSITDFPEQVTVAFCARLGDCCLVPQSTWNQADCVQLIQSAGGFRGINRYSPSLDSGNVTYDPTGAAKCLSDLRALPCGLLTSPEALQLQSECFGALIGQLTVDAGPCRTSIECAANEFCTAVGDAGGTCAPLTGMNQPCTRSNSEECSYLGTGTPAAYCALAADGGPGTCQPTVAIDGGCTLNNQCQSGLCDYPTCGSQLVFSDPGVMGGTCDFFTIKDAGGGG